MMQVSAKNRKAFTAFFCAATGFAPYKWQIRLATEGLPALLPVPTGLGKTEGVTLAWAWRLATGADEPRHLVYCLPMRTLVRQTVERLTRYFAVLAREHFLSASVYQLMGGAIDDEWARWPDKPWLLVGTQDQLLSRALNRGYAMSRFEWPVHFGLLNQDCRWIIDEVQLMGPGAWTTAQLDWMRAKRFRTLRTVPTTWMSATVGAGFMATTDRKRDRLHIVSPFDPQLDEDRRVGWWRDAKRPVYLFDSSQSTSLTLAEEIARDVDKKHHLGTLSFVICNTVTMARDVFNALSASAPKILLTSQFRRRDREQHEQRLLAFEISRREHAGKPIPGDPGLICVSTQVVEAGVDISAHHLWSELAPWPSLIQRLGRLNRDGRDQSARAWVWDTPSEDYGKPERIGPYEADDILRAKKLLDALRRLAATNSFSVAMAKLEIEHKGEVEAALQLRLAPLPRALDVHGLFSTERDVHGGFTDVSAFVRGSDPDADVTVFWREWPGAAPGGGDELDGPDPDLPNEGCPVPFFRLRDFLKGSRTRGWMWNDEADQWENVRPDDLRPGMVIMLHRDTGGYDAHVGWTGRTVDLLSDVPRTGRGRALRDDERTEVGHWERLDMHLKDVKQEAERLCDGVGLRNDDEQLRALRTAVIAAAAWHDLGKAHPQWQEALPAVSGLSGAPWAKCPPVLAIDSTSNAKLIHKGVVALRSDALRLEDQRRRRGREDLVRLRWAVGQRLSRNELDQLKSVFGVRWAGHIPFRPGLRHEAASVLAMSRRYREGTPAYSALAVYLVAAHHGKVRTVLRATTDKGVDVFGVARDPAVINFSAERWPLDYSVAKDGAEGRWQNGQFVLTGHGWTGIVADLLGPWREGDQSAVGAVPSQEPRQLGPFVLAYLEALVRVADWRGSQSPSQTINPAEVRRDR
jgi:CRISPR-associated endonuclease/helicase Cas3